MGRHYLQEDDREELRKLQRNNVCAECGGELEVFYDIRKHLPYLECKSNPSHSGIAKEFKLTRYQRDGLDSLNLITRREQMTQDYGDETSRELTVRNVPLSGVLTKAQATLVLKTIWKDAPDVEVYKAAVLCRDYGLHPLMKHIFLIPFNVKGGGKSWVTVLGISATRLMMSRQGSFSYVDNTPRVMREDEEISIYGKVEPTLIRAITKLKTRDGLEAQGYGHWQRDTVAYGREKGNTEANMAFIRSERNAFSRLFPDALPQGIEVVDESYIETAAGRVNEKTGEIVEKKGEVAEEKAEAKVEAGAQVPAPKAEKPVEKKAKPKAITPEELKELAHLCSECGWTMSDFGKFCNKEKGWKISTLEDLTRVQYDEVVAVLKKALGLNGKA